MADGGKGSSVERTPDALGDGGRADVALSTLRNIQQQQASLRAEVAMNDLGDDSPCPSATQSTVAERRRFLQAAERRLVEEFANEMPRVRELLERQQAAEKAERERQAREAASS